MENNYNDLNIKMLNLILEKLNNKTITKSNNKKKFRIDKILSVNIKNCKYVGGENPQLKKHLKIKFTSPDENGPIYLSVLFDNYSDYFINVSNIRYLKCLKH
jgi:hypothetical protein